MAKEGKSKATVATQSEDDLRQIILQYFYDRNTNATSARGKKGYAVKISDVRKELKASHGLKQQEVVRNLNYLMSQGWIAEEHVHKSVPLPSGTIIPQATSYYKITAEGIDKIEGDSEFTMDKFKGIRIEATGQNIITVGDGNQVNAQYEDLASELVGLKDSVRKSEHLREAEKLDAVADIDTIESQLAKTTPNKGVIKGAWETIKGLDQVAGLAGRVAKVAGLIAPLL